MKKIILDLNLIIDTYSIKNTINNLKVLFKQNQIENQI